MKATPLHMATFLGHSEIGEELLKYSKTNVNAVDKVRFAKILITGLGLSANRTLAPLPHKSESNKNMKKTPKMVPITNFLCPKMSGHNFEKICLDMKH